MFKKLQSLIGKKAPHPAMHWPVMDMGAPPLQTAAQQVGDLKFGSPLDGAIQFGAPEQVQEIEGDAINLVYAKVGFQLEFDEGVLTSAAYFVGPDEYTPPFAQLQYCEPVINSHRLTSSDDSASIQQLFGAPTRVDEDSDETILFYELNGLCVEFEFSPSHALKRVNVYPL